MAAAGLAIDPELVRFGAAFTEPEGARLCRELMTHYPTAIVAGNDLMALGCYDVFLELGLHCPTRSR